MRHILFDEESQDESNINKIEKFSFYLTFIIIEEHFAAHNT